MACTICDHTMSMIVDDVFWCPRCGTLRVEGQDVDESPLLVGRCRQFQAILYGGDRDTLQRRWGQFGIRESINLPEKRKEQS